MTKLGSMKGELKDKAEFERREYKEFKVEASNLNPHKQDPPKHQLRPN